MIEHHVMRNPYNAKRVRISVRSVRQREEFGMEGNCIAGWTTDPRIKRIMEKVPPEQVSYE